MGLATFMEQGLRQRLSLQRLKMDIGIIKQDNQIMDLIVKSNVVRELPIYNNLVRQALIDKVEEKNGMKQFRNAMIGEILK